MDDAPPNQGVGGAPFVCGHDFTLWAADPNPNSGNAHLQRLGCKVRPDNASGTGLYRRKGLSLK